MRRLREPLVNGECSPKLNSSADSLAPGDGTLARSANNLRLALAIADKFVRTRVNRVAACAHLRSCDLPLREGDLHGPIPIRSLDRHPEPLACGRALGRLRYHRQECFG